MRVIMDLTESELYTIWSRYKKGMEHLEISGDYPEKKVDQLTAKKLINARSKLLRARIKLEKDTE